MLTLEAVTAGYGGGDVLQGVDLELEENRVACIVGPNGAGKSTVLRTLSGLLRPRVGEITLDGADITGEAQAAAALGMTGSTFPARKALSQARRLGHAGVSRAIEVLAPADVALKGGLEWSPELVLEVLVARLSRLAPRGAPERRR